MYYITTREYTKPLDGINEPVSLMRTVVKSPDGDLTKREIDKYISENACYGIRGYLRDELKTRGIVTWFTSL